MLGLMIGSQLYEYFDRQESPEQKYFRISREFRVMVHSREANRRFRNLAADTAQAATSIEDLVGKVVADRKKNETAARLYVSMRYEMGKEVLPEDLEFLKKSKLPENRTFAELYGPTKLTKDQVLALSAKLPKQGWTFRLAEIHALEKAGDKGARKRLLVEKEVYGPYVVAILGLLSLFLGLGLLLLYGAMRLNGRFLPKGHPSGVLDSAGANRLAGAAALLLFLYNFLGLPISVLLKSFLPREAASTAAQVVIILVAIALALRFRDRFGLQKSQIFGERGEIWKDLAWGVGGFFANIPLFLCGAILGQSLFSWLPDPEHPVTTLLSVDQSLPTVLMIVFLACVLAPIFEEMVFRGAVVPSMAYLFGGPFMGIVAAGLLFAAVHPTGIPAWPALAIIGSSAAILVYQRGNLRAAMIFHACHNLSLLMLNLAIN